LSIVWQDHSIGMMFGESDMEDQKWSSSLGTDQFGLSTENFEVVEFKLKSQSEHTINGQHYDLEL
jgi:carbonic anhydrase